MLALLYTITVGGFALNLHYCGNYVADVEINAPAEACAKPMAKSKMNCCKDSKLEVKVKDNHEAQPTSFLAKIFAFELPKLSFKDFFLPAQQALLDWFFDRGPPGLSLGSVSVYLKNCNFRI